MCMDIHTNRQTYRVTDHDDSMYCASIAQRGKKSIAKTQARHSFYVRTVDLKHAQIRI